MPARAEFQSHAAPLKTPGPRVKTPGPSIVTPDVPLQHPMAPLSAPALPLTVPQPPLSNPLSSSQPSSHRPMAEEELLFTPPCAFAATPAGLTAWAMHAGAGRVCVYARMARLARGGVGERARQLYAQGLVALLPQRPSSVAADRLFDYRMRRTDRAFRDAAAVPDDRGLAPDARLLLDLVAAFDAEDTVLPCNRDLAALLGLKRPEQVTRLLGQLQHRALIAVEYHADGLRRATVR